MDLSDESYNYNNPLMFYPHKQYLLGMEPE